MSGRTRRDYRSFKITSLYGKISSVYYSDYMYTEKKELKNKFKVDWQSPWYPFYKKFWLIYTFIKREIRLFFNEYNAFKIDKMRQNKIKKEDSLLIFSENLEKKYLFQKENQLLNTNLRDKEYANIIKKADSIINNISLIPKTTENFFSKITNWTNFLFEDPKEEMLNKNILQQELPEKPLTGKKKRTKKKHKKLLKKLEIFTRKTKQKIKFIPKRPLFTGGIIGILFISFSFIFIIRFKLTSTMYATNEFEDIISFSPTPSVSSTPTIILKDQTPPLLNIISGPENLSMIKFNNFCFETKISDNITSFDKLVLHWSFDNSNWSDWSNNTAFCFNNITNGNHVFSIQAKDEAENLSNAETRQFTVIVP